MACSTSETPVWPWRRLVDVILQTISRYEGGQGAAPRHPRLRGPIELDGDLLYIVAIDHAAIGKGADGDCPAKDERGVVGRGRVAFGIKRLQERTWNTN